jgi:hypothetical protein
MEPKKTVQPAPHAGEREKGTRQDGEAMPPQSLDPKPTGKNSAGRTRRGPTPGSAEGERDPDEQSR